MRAWVMAYKGQTGKFPELPSEEAGGSALIFSRQGADSELGSKSTAPSSKEGKGEDYVQPIKPYIQFRQVRN
jgi:hypothetical protein